jgi:hypothetical protein
LADLNSSISEVYREDHTRVSCTTHVSLSPSAHAIALECMRTSNHAPLARSSCRDLSTPAVTPPPSLFFLQSACPYTIAHIQLRPSLTRASVQERPKHNARCSVPSRDLCASPSHTVGNTMELPLRDYLAGHVLRKAMLLFEGAMGPWVKAEVKAHFCVKLGIAADDDDRVAAEHEATLRAHDAKMAALVARRDELVQLIRTCHKEERMSVKTERESVDEQLKKLYAVPTPPTPVPQWIEECRLLFGPAMKHHVNAPDRWDVHTIVVVMRALLRDVFARHLPDHFHAKELLSGIIRVLSMRAARAHRVVMVESDVLGALQQMVSVMRQCQCDPSAVTAVSTLLDDAKALVQQAREVEGDGAVCAGPTLTEDDANAQQLYTALTAWELHIELTMEFVTVRDGGVLVDTHRGRLAYKDGTVVFGRDLEDRWTEVVQSLKSHFPMVACARHWYFHNLPGVCNFADAFATMQITAAAIAIAAAAGHPHWHPPPVANTAVPTTLRLQTPSVRMSVPVARVDEIVGRESTVERVAAALTPGARVLLHGLPGVGKDTVMAEVAHRPEIQSLGGLQAWLQASSDVVLRRQLIELFATHRPRVVAGLDNDAPAAIAAIKRWLASYSDWVLFVEDASLGSTTLWDVLPGACILTPLFQLFVQSGSENVSLPRYNVLWSEGNACDQHIVSRAVHRACRTLYSDVSSFGSMFTVTLLRVYKCARHNVQELVLAGECS